MKAAIYFFSGTGNTALIAKTYKKYLNDYETTLCPVRMKKEGKKFSFESFCNPEEMDLLAFAYPVHGFNSPQVMVNFCKNFPVLKNKKKAFIFKTSGEGLKFNNYSSQKIIKILEKKGISFLSERHYVMPYNMIFRHSPEMVKNEWIYASALVRLHCREIREGKIEKVHTNFLKGWFLPLFRIEWLYARLQGPAMKVDEKKCLHCMKCVKNCPMDNISFRDGKFVFGTNCALCVCCSFNCPTKAISIGLLNGWRVNGEYKIQETARNSKIEFPVFTEKLKGLKRWAYLGYYKKLDEKLRENKIELNQESDFI